MSENIVSVLRDTRKARRHGPAAIQARQSARLADAVAFARAHSAYYRELYRGLPERVEDASFLPVTTKNTRRLQARLRESVCQCYSLANGLCPSRSRGDIAARAVADGGRGGLWLLRSLVFSRAGRFSQRRCGRLRWLRRGTGLLRGAPLFLLFQHHGSRRVCSNV